VCFFALHPPVLTILFSSMTNALQMSDGAGAVLLMKRSKANQLNLPIEGTFVSFAVKGRCNDALACVLTIITCAY
jgi:hypothetical protein